MPRRINIPDPKELLRNIAGMYQSATRVIMEYIDNSLDDAEYFYENEGRYLTPLRSPPRSTRRTGVSRSTTTAGG